jgi:hypothetical protein
MDFRLPVHALNQAKLKIRLGSHSAARSTLEAVLRWLPIFTCGFSLRANLLNYFEQAFGKLSR